MIGIVVNRYNKRVNPPDIADENASLSTVRSPLEYLDSQVKKYIHVYKDYNKMDNQTDE